MNTFINYCAAFLTVLSFFGLTYEEIKNKIPPINSLHLNNQVHYANSSIRPTPIRNECLTEQNRVGQAIVSVPSSKPGNINVSVDLKTSNRHGSANVKVIVSN